MLLIRPTSSFKLRFSQMYTVTINEFNFWNVNFARDPKYS